MFVYYKNDFLLMEVSLPEKKKLRKGSVKDPYCVNAVKVCMEQNQTDKETLSTLFTLGISMNQRMLTRIKSNIYDFQNILENEQTPSREKIRVETIYLIDEQIQQLRHLANTTMEVSTRIKASHTLSTFLLQRLKLYRFPLHD